MEKDEVFTQLNVPRAELISVIKEQSGVRDPHTMDPKTKDVRDKSKYCAFHKDHGPDMASCIHLKRPIRRLIYKGALVEYKANRHMGTTTIIGNQGIVLST